MLPLVLHYSHRVRAIHWFVVKRDAGGRRSIVLQLVSHIPVPVQPTTFRDADRSNIYLLSLRRLSVVPLCAAERTGHVVHLRPGPLIETPLVHIVATRSTTPHDLLSVFELHAADRTIVFDWLAITIRLSNVFFCHLARQCWGVGEDFYELSGEEGILLLQAIWCFEDIVQNIERVLAELLSVLASEDADWTGAARNVRDGDGVDVASGSCNLDCFARTVVVVGVAGLLNSTLAVEDEHTLGVGTLESVVVRLRRIVHVAM